MDLSTITMDRTAARKAFLDYRRGVRDRHDEEDEALMRGYRELARGRQLLSLTQAMRRAGLDHRGYPRLGICQATSRTCRLDITNERAMFLADGANRWGRVRKGRRITLRGVFPAYEPKTPRPDVSAIVPSVPISLRPKGLHLYHVLWEADWQPEPPRDPALLRHLEGDLWAVVAVWDLTELERAVLVGRGVQDPFQQL